MNHTLLIMTEVMNSKRQHHKMVKHTQTIRRLLPTNYLSVLDILRGWRLRSLFIILLKTNCACETQ